MVGAAPIPVLESSGVALAQLCLRLATGAQSGRLVKLSARRCTLGSGPGCTLRLKAAGVAPLHCVIERTPAETVIRGGEGQIWLDGQPVSEASLVRGSRLKLGSIEFVVEDEGRLPAEPFTRQIEPTAAQAACSPPADTPESAQLKQDLEQRLEQLDQTLDQLGRELIQHTQWRSDWQSGLSRRLQEELDQASPAWTANITDTVTALVASSVTTDLRRWLEEELTTLGGQLAADVTSHVCTLVTPQVSEAVHDQLNQSLAVQLTAQLERCVTASLEELAPRMQGELKKQIAEEVKQREAPLRQALASDVQAEIRNWLDGEQAAAGERLAAQVASQVKDELTPGITDAVTANLSATLETRLDEKLSMRVQAEVAQTTTSAVEQAATSLAEELSAQLNDKLSAEVVAELDRRQAPWREAMSGEVKDEVGQQLTHALADCVAIQVREQLAQVMPDLTQQVEDLSRKSHDGIRAQIVEEIGRQSAQSGAEPNDNLSAETAQRVLEQVTGQLEARLAEFSAAGQPDSLPQQWADQIGEDIASHIEGLSSQLAREVTDRVRNQLNEQIAAHVTRQVAAEQAALEAQRAAWEQQQKKSQEELNLHAQHLEQRLEALTRFQRGLDEQHHQWQHDLQALRPEVLAQAEQIQQHAAQWHKALEEAAAEQSALRAELERRQAEAAQESQQLAARLESLADRWTAIERQNQPSQAESALHAHSGQIDLRLAGIRAEREALQHDRQHDAEDRNLPHPGERAHALDERLTEPCLAGESQRRERQHIWQDEASTCEDSPAPDPLLAEQAAEELDSSDQCGETSSDDSLDAGSSTTEPSLPSKLFAHLLREEEAEQEEEPAQAAQHLASQVGGHAEDSTAHSDDESIENYMARLMDRVRVMQGAPSSPQPVAGEAASSPRRRETPASVAAPDAASELPKVKDLSELVPRSAPAELTSNISAMRDLANLTARSAIDTHSRKRMRSKVWGKLFVAFVALAAAVALTWMSSAAGQLAYGAALVSTIVAVIWGLEYLILSGYHFWWRDKAGASREVAPAANDGVSD